MQDWLKMTAADLGRGIARGEIGPVALTQTYLDAIDGHDLRDQIYARVTHERAMAEAEAAEKRAKMKQRRSLLDGVPISWKDLFDTAGIVTEAGSALLHGRVPDMDAVVLKNATAMGTVCLGKTHMSELAYSGLGYNPVTDTPPNVNYPNAVPGGSSSGAAASVAFDLAPAGIGSDTGGSVRVPSAWNDLVGLKTTAGRLTLEGVVPLVLKFDTIGPLCRSVEDAALLLAVMEGTPPADLKGVSLQGRRFAILRTLAFDEIREEPLKGFDAAVERLRDAGAMIEDIEIPEVAEANALSVNLFSPEAYGLWKDVIETNPDVMYSEILARFRLGAEVSAPDYVGSSAALEGLRVAYDRAASKYDAVLLPSSPILPPDLERLKADSDFYVSENLLTLRNTRIGNLMGLCGLTLPTGVPSCGLMMLGQPDMEEALLRVGAAAEKALS